MSSFVIEGGYRLSGEIVPQGAKNEALEVICATLLTPEKVTKHNVPDILDVNNLIHLLRDMRVKVEHPSAGVPVFEKPAGRYAAICLQGDYHRARGAYRQLLEEISARGLRPVGCSYKEGLWDEIAQRDPAQYRTKISVAVE